MKKLTQLALAAMAITAAGQACATVPVLSYSVDSNVIANAKGTTAGLDFAKFDTSLGALQSVQVELFSHLNTIVKVENTSRNSAASIVSNAGSVLTFTLTGVTQTLTSSASHTFNASIFDGMNNFAGTSGEAYTFASLFTDSASYSAPSTLALFSGVGNLHAGLNGVSSSAVNGISGNTRSLVLPSFDGYAKVTYNYTAPVPEPETYAMLLAGLGLVGATSRRRKPA